MLLLFAHLLSLAFPGFGENSVCQHFTAFLQMYFSFGLQGSEQDLALTRKLLKTKGDMSGKGMSSA